MAFNFPILLLHSLYRESVREKFPRVVQQGKKLRSLTKERQIEVLKL